MIRFLRRDGRAGKYKEGIIPWQRLASYLFLMRAYLLWEVCFKYFRPVSASVDFLGYQFIAGIAVHKSLKPRLVASQVGFDEKMAARAEIIMDCRGKKTGIGPEVENIDGRGFVQVGRNTLKDIGYATGHWSVYTLGLPLQTHNEASYTPQSLSLTMLAWRTVRRLSFFSTCELIAFVSGYWSTGIHRCASTFLGIDMVANINS